MERSAVGYMYTTGRGDFGQLGFESDEAQLPTIVEALENVRVRRVVCGSLQTWVLTEKGQVISFGNNDDGSLGRETPNEIDEFTPGLVKLPDVCTHIAGGESHCAALLQNGEVYAWGSFRLTDEWRHGVDFRTEEKVTKKPVVISTNLPKVIQIAAGSRHLVMLCEDGNVLTLGHGIAGQLGRKLPDRFRGDILKHLLEPAKVHLITSSKHHKGINIWAGEYTTFVQCQTSFWVFGCNSWRQCGVSGKDRVLIVYPTAKNELSSQKWKCIAGGVHHTIALNSEGTTYCFGRNTEGQCGIPRRENRVVECVEVPTIVPELEAQHIIKVAAGNRSSFAINGDGNLFVWGLREYIGLGDEVNINQGIQEQPRLITSNVVDVRDVDGGDQHSAMVIQLLNSGEAENSNS